MKTVANVDELRRLALTSGATLTMNGQVFNTDKAKVPARPAQPAPLPQPQPIPAVVASVAPPVPASEPGSITRTELAEILASRDAFWMAEMQRMAQTIASTFAAVAGRSAPHGWRFTANYKHGQLVDYIDAVPRDPATEH